MSRLVKGEWRNAVGEEEEKACSAVCKFLKETSGQLRQDRVGEDACSRHGGRAAECTFSGLADQRREIADWFTAKSNQKRWRGIIGTGDDVSASTERAKIRRATEAAVAWQDVEAGDDGIVQKET